VPKCLGAERSGYPPTHYWGTARVSHDIAAGVGCAQLARCKLLSGKLPGRSASFQCEVLDNPRGQKCEASKPLTIHVGLFAGYLMGAAAPGSVLDLRPVILLSEIVQPIGLVRL